MFGKGVTRLIPFVESAFMVTCMDAIYKSFLEGENLH